MENIVQLLGTPVAAARPRVLKSGFTFDPKSKEKQDARKMLFSQWRDGPTRNPVSLDISFEMPIPRSLSKKKQEALIGQPHISKPDCDNLAKFVLDAMNKIIYEDDSHVFELHVKKIYSEDPKTIIVIKKASDSDID